MTGGFSDGPFRTGASAGSLTETILNSLNSLRGTAYTAEPGTIVYVENNAIARVLADAWETSRRFANQFDPVRMTTYLSRWEEMFKVVPTFGETNTERRATLQTKFQLFNVPPFPQTVKDFLSDIDGAIFLDVLHTKSTQAAGHVPGGFTITGGATYPDGDWNSTVANVAVRLYQPLDWSDGEFYDQANKFASFFDGLLPAHVTFDWGRYTYVPPGTITAASGAFSITGTGTLFLTDPSNPLDNGDEIEVFDDNGNLHTLIVDTVTSDTTATLQLPAPNYPNTITNKHFKIKGFVLDQDLNIDNSFFK